MPACFNVLINLPVLSPNNASVPMPVSNSTTRSPKLATSTFCSSTALSAGKKLSCSSRAISSLVMFWKAAEGSPSGNWPSETMVHSASPSLKR